jgi:hypothetical protein
MYDKKSPGGLAASRMRAIRRMRRMRQVPGHQLPLPGERPASEARLGEGWPEGAASGEGPDDRGREVAVRPNLASMAGREHGPAWRAWPRMRSVAWRGE